MDTSREALGQRKSRRVEGREGAAAHQPPQQRHLLRLPGHHQPPVDVRRHRYALHRELVRPRALRGLRIDKGALPLCNAICGICRDSPYEREWGTENGGRPSSKPASAAPGLMSGLAVGLGRSSGPGRPHERQWPESAAQDLATSRIARSVGRCNVHVSLLRRPPARDTRTSQPALQPTCMLSGGGGAPQRTFRHSPSETVVVRRL